MWRVPPFEKHLEAAFQRDLLSEKVRMTRVIALMAFALNALFYPLDHYALPSALDAAYNLRLVIAMTALGIFAATYSSHFADAYEFVAGGALLILGLCINALMLVAASTDVARNDYYAGLIMIAVALHTMTHVRPSRSAMLSGALIVLYIGCTLLRADFVLATSGVVLVTNLSFLVSCTVIALIAQLAKDRYTRENFVLRQSLHADVKAKEEHAKLVTHIAEHDMLTSLPNRMQFEREAHKRIQSVDATTACVVVMFLDLDHFKPVNDCHGHAAGDRVLREIAHRIRRAAGEEDIVARIGGDEFVICMTRTHAAVAQISMEAAQVQSAIQQTIRVRDHDIHLTASIGVAAYPFDGEGLQSVVNVADSQMYQSKQANTPQRINLSAGLQQLAQDGARAPARASGG